VVQENARKQAEQQRRQKEADTRRRQRETEEEAELGIPLVSISMTVTSTDPRTNQRRQVSSAAKLFPVDDPASASLRFCEKHELLNKETLLDGGCDS
jgi:hypothetical protein